VRVRYDGFGLGHDGLEREEFNLSEIWVRVQWVKEKERKKEEFRG